MILSYNLMKLNSKVKEYITFYERLLLLQNDNYPSIRTNPYSKYINTFNRNKRNMLLNVCIKITKPARASTAMN